MSVVGRHMRQKRHSYIFLKSVPTPEFLHYRALVCGYGKNKSRSSALLQNINHYLLHKAVREPERTPYFWRRSFVWNSDVRQV